MSARTIPRWCWRLRPASQARARATLAAGLAVAGAGALVLAGAHSPWQAFAGAAGSGLGVSVAWPAQDVLLSRLETQNRSAVFGVRYATMNLGLAVGALA